MADYRYVPSGFPWARYTISLLYLLVFAGTLLAVLTDHASLNPEESNFVFLLAGTLAATWERVIGFWFSQANGEQPNGNNKAVEVEEDDAFTKANKKFSTEKRE